MEEQTTRRTVVVVGVVSVFFAVMAVALGWGIYQMTTSGSRQAASLAESPRHQISEHAISEMRTEGALTAWQLDGGLDTAAIHDILVDDDGEGAWIGSGLGLVRFEPEGRIASYRLYGDAPNEWVRDLVRWNGDIALTITVATGNTGGHTVATFLFDPDTGDYERIGEYARELASDGTDLFGVINRDLVRFVRGPDGWVTEPVLPDARICREIDLTHAAGALWMTQQGQVRSGGQSSRDIPCGVTRLVPGGAQQTWMEEDGLASGFGRSIVGDVAAVFASHGIQGDGLSVFDPATNTWGSRRGGSGIRFNANVLGLSPRSVWLGTPAGERPLVRIDRGTGEAEIVAGTQENHYVSAIAGGPSGAWAGWSLKLYEGSTYSLQTWLVRIYD